jgi:hypothetical protein
MGTSIIPIDLSTAVVGTTGDINMSLSSGLCKLRVRTLATHSR